MVQKSAAETAAPAPTRGRPRKFDTDEVLARARNVFWKYGYAGTSMDQLAVATGLHKPSLYGAFGDKKALYLAALDNYLAEVRAEFAEAFALPKLADSLHAVTERSIEKYGDGAGCFMMNTAIPVAAEDPEIARIVRETMESLDRALTRRFRKAVEAGELPEAADLETLTMVMAANNHELSAKARAGYSRQELREMSDRALAMVERLSGAGTA